MLYTKLEPILVSATYVFGSGYHYTLWDNRICLVDYKYLHSDTLDYKLLKGTRKWQLAMPYTAIATYMFGSGHHYTLWDSCICLVDYKYLHSDTLGYKLL